MTNSKSTKRALVSSAFAVFMCVAMLIGTTFAWFTDTASTSVNSIKSGNLDIEVEYSLDGTEWKTLDNASDIFQKGLWEPGHSEVVALKVHNAGNLAGKYTISMNIVNETKGVNKFGNEFALSDYLKVYTMTSGGSIGSMLVSYAFTNRNASASWDVSDFSAIGAIAKDISLPVYSDTYPDQYFVVKVTMPETVGNEANAISTDKAPSIDFGINVVATQAPAEADSYDKNYDANATYATTVGTTDELVAAIQNGEDVVLTNNVSLPEALEVTGDVTIYGNGEYKLDTTDTRVINVNDNTESVTLTLSGVDIDAANVERGISVYGNSGVTIVMDNCSASADHYALNIASDNTNTDVVVRNSTLIGYSAFQTWSAGTNATFENCTLIGNNKWSGADDDYGAIVIYSSASDSTLTFKNCRIEANELGTATEYFLDSRATGVTVTFDGCEFFVNGTEVTGDAIQSNMACSSDTNLIIK